MSTGETWIPSSVLTFKGFVTTGSVATGGTTTSDNLRDGIWSFKITTSAGFVLIGGTTTSVGFDLIETFCFFIE